MNKAIGFITFLGFLSITVFAGQHPNIFLNQTEIDAIMVKVNAGASPWKSAYSSMISAANSSLSAGAKSVADNGAGVGGNGNVHLFSTDAPYTSCTSLNRGDLNAAEHMSKHIQNLGLAYAFTKQAKYADKCIALLKHWMTNPATYMYPLNRNWSPHTAGCGKQWCATNGSPSSICSPQRRPATKPRCSPNRWSRSAIRCALTLTLC